MSPAERVKLGFELSEWAMKTNKSYKIELEKRSKVYYIEMISGKLDH